MSPLFFPRAGSTQYPPCPRLACFYRTYFRNTGFGRGKSSSESAAIRIGAKLTIGGSISIAVKDRRASRYHRPRSQPDGISLQQQRISPFHGFGLPGTSGLDSPSTCSRQTGIDSPFSSTDSGTTESDTESLDRSDSRLRQPVQSHRRSPSSHR